MQQLDRYERNRDSRAVGIRRRDVNSVDSFEPGPHPTLQLITESLVLGVHFELYKRGILARRLRATAAPSAAIAARKSLMPLSECNRGRGILTSSSLSSVAPTWHERPRARLR